MSTPEQPDTPPLTRKQLRDIRNTGATPVIDAEAAAAAAASPDAEPSPAVAPPPAPLARAAEPVVLPEPPVADLDVDLGVSPLTRRQARQQERIRTASVPVITPELAAAYAAGQTPGEYPMQSPDAAARPIAPPPVVPVDVSTAPLAPFEALGVAALADATASEPETTALILPEHEPETATAAEPEPEPEAQAEPESEPLPEHQPESDEEPDVFAELAQTDEAPQEQVPQEHEGAEPDERVVVSPAFGAALLAGASGEPAGAPSFDDLITRSSNGSSATPNALILTQSPEDGPIIAPLSATGGVLITGMLNLPEGLGSTGHAPGVADGKEADAVLVDGELPAHSSPTPIAASAAISTVKTPGEIIKPPTPEKGGRLMMTLAITAGVLALALVGVLILAFATGVF